MRHEPHIDLTESEQGRLAEFAQQRGVSIEEAAAQLAKKSITTYFVIPTKTSTVIPFRSPKRA